MKIIYFIVGAIAITFWILPGAIADYFKQLSWRFSCWFYGWHEGAKPEDKEVG